MKRIALFAAILLIAAPAFAETTSAMKPATPAAPVQTGKMPDKMTDMHRVNINSATLAQLTAVPGLTRTEAEAIIKGRPFKTVTDLASAKILPADAFARSKDYLTVVK